MVRLLIVSDIHGAVEKARRLARIRRDVTVVAGDIARCGSIEEAREVLSVLAAQSPVVWVPGNCDSPESPGIRVENAECIHLKAVSMAGLVFAGVGGSVATPFGTPFEYSEEEFARMLQQLRSIVKGYEDRLVLVSHTPPYMSGLDRVRGGEYVGSPSLRSFIAEVKPLLVATGHIHEAWGSACVEGVPVVNPGPLEAGRYALVDLDPGRGMARVQLARISEAL
ncbi:hypothetical protein CF15_00120 [Pyrodictium occultum]|uniref:Calcineurin-like phosphoesterase domain-containing protein n=1 Tax=Pyrodictium occultum TaxID=2309 RepID=A0A0V8RTC4_PYROC|nr:metallophosphoesterase [Pyrodictium occultum]KSW11316.1 hypothetical protein CF15_00120 [Pyrodictium occultum]